jgi:hypothetical protein
MDKYHQAFVRMMRDNNKACLNGNCEVCYANIIFKISDAFEFSLPFPVDFGDIDFHRIPTDAQQQSDLPVIKVFHPVEIILTN